MSRSYFRRLASEKPIRWVDYGVTSLAICWCSRGAGELQQGGADAVCVAVRDQRAGGGPGTRAGGYAVPPGWAEHRADGGRRCVSGGDAGGGGGGQARRGDGLAIAAPRELHVQG